LSTSQDFKKRMREQLGFIERSAAGFDQGHREEAMRIATALRVIFHHTNSSTSLLHHLNATMVKIRSDAPDRQKQNAALGGKKIIGEFSWSLASVTPAAGGKFAPCADPNAPHRILDAPDWWQEVFAHVDGCDYTRRAVVLWAANKDGGAHVDDVLPPEYEAIKGAGALGHFELQDGSKADIEDAHFTFLRTMAFEVLNSPDLAALGR
jgi:hypothetical protein